MNFCDSAEWVADDLGEKVIHALGRAVAATREDLDTYRSIASDWVADHSESGLAQWIQERLWSHTVAGLDLVSGVTVVERGSTREIVVNRTVSYTLRIKRHHLDGLVSNYPTQAALRFFDQPAPQFSGMESARLIAGYEWDCDTHTIVRPVLSFRDGRDNIVWLSELPETGEGTAVVLTPTVEAPTAPTIEVRDIADTGEDVG